ncbi:MAG: DUF308 domain-containing protein [Clostridia bacterium]|nr:DUF308 domain-containing protein [Clostridia bacterium]
MSLTKKAKITFIILSILGILIGTCLIIWPSISAVTLCYIFGGLTVLVGVIRIICYFRGEVYGLPVFTGFAEGTLDILVGVLLILHPGTTVDFLPVLVGVMVIIDSLFELQASIELLGLKVMGGWSVLLIAVLGAVLGVLLIIDPFSGKEVLMIMIGVSLIANGIQGLTAIGYVSRFIKENFVKQTIYVKK